MSVHVLSTRATKARLAVGLAALLAVALLASLVVALRPASAEPSSATQPGVATQNQRPTRDVALAIHVGTASLRPGQTSPETIAAYEEAMTAALERGRDIIESGGSSVDATQAAVEVLEDDPTFNAGRGAVFNTDAAHELDAAIMDGATLDAGAVAGVRNVKNPIAAARLVMDESPHVMLAGQGADTFALASGLETVTQDYFFTQARWDALMNAKGRTGAAAATDGAAEDAGDGTGTVGAVARDRNGNLAAATSTGGLTNKAVGRVGDSPIIGAGTWASNDSVAVSGTGTGEVYIRLGAARDVAALTEYRFRGNVQRAAEMVLDKIRGLGGTGGLLVLDNRGTLATPRTGGMPTGYVTTDGEIVLDLFRTS